MGRRKLGRLVPTSFSLTHNKIKAGEVIFMNDLKAEINWRLEGYGKNIIVGIIIISIS